MPYARSIRMEDRTLIERLARHLAASDPHDWPARLEDAASILAILKEPDVAMRAVGETAQWGAMIDAALGQRWALAPAPAGQPDTPPDAAGADEEGEISLPPDAVGHDRADWVHLHHGQETHR